MTQATASVSAVVSGLSICLLPVGDMWRSMGVRLGLAFLPVFQTLGCGGHDT